MSINKGNNNNSNKPGGPDEEKPKGKGRFNLYWIYGLILLGLLGLQFFSFDNVEEISQKQFEQQMLKEGDVKKLEVINGKEVDVYLTEDALKKNEYEDVAKRRFGGGLNPGPHYKFQILDPGKFQERMNELQKDVPEDQQVEIFPKTTHRLDRSTAQLAHSRSVFLSSSGYSS